MIEAAVTIPFSVVAVVPADQVSRWYADGWRSTKATEYTVTCIKRFGSESEAWRAGRKLRSNIVWALEP